MKRFSAVDAAADSGGLDGLPAKGEEEDARLLTPVILDANGRRWRDFSRPWKVLRLAMIWSIPIVSPKGPLGDFSGIFL